MGKMIKGRVEDSAQTWVPHEEGGGHFEDPILTKPTSLGGDARQKRIAELEDWRPLLIKYTLRKIELEDWHGVADGAMDLRDLDSELDGLRY